MNLVKTDRRPGWGVKAWLLISQGISALSLIPWSCMALFYIVVWHESPETAITVLLYPLFPLGAAILA